MGLLGGDSQSTAQLTSNINFNPTNIIGSGNLPSSSQSSSQTPSQTPRLTDKLAASVGVLGGHGGAVVPGGDVQAGARQAPTPQGLFPHKSVNPSTMLGIVAVLAGGMIIIEKKRKKKKK